METIEQLLSRIRWDEEFGRGEFEVGINDRVKDAVEFHPLDDCRRQKGNHFSFTLCIAGEVLAIPFHRIREVRKNGETLWKR